MIILHDYSFEGLRSFADKQTISLEGRDKLIQFDGKNLNTGGSSGSGKSTAIIAIDYLFGVSDIPATVLQSWVTDKDMVVEGNFTFDGIKTYIKRSKKKGLLLQYGKEEFQGTLAEEKLQEIISIPKSVFKQMIHKKQDEKGFFLGKTAKQMYDFLIEMLNLSDQDKKLKKISEDIAEITKSLESSNNSINNTEKSITELESILDSKKAPESIDTSGLDDLVKQRDDLKEKLKAMSAQKHVALKSVLKPEMPSFEPYDTARLSKLEEGVSILRQKQATIDHQVKDLNHQLFSVESDKSAIKQKAQDAVNKSKKLQELMNNTCYTCKQHYSGDDATKTKAQLQEEIEQIKKVIMALKANVDKEPEILKEISLLESQSKKIMEHRDNLNSQISEEKKNAAEHKKRYDEQIEKINMSSKNKELEISSKWDTAINKLQQDIWPLESQIQKMESDKASFEQMMSTYKTECDSLKQKIDTYKKFHVEEHKKLEENDKKLKVAQEAHRLIKAYTIQVFQDTLNLIGDTATEMISSIPNIQNSSIYFEGCKENKSGTIKDEVTPVITLNGHNKIPIKAFSGGEKTAIELAVDLAVIDIIEAKTGKGANFFILDEPFNGLDSVCKESCLEVLKQYDTNKKIIMVDHSSELKEMVSDVITIVKEGEVSFVE